MSEPNAAPGSWQRGSTAKSVQHAYVNARVHTINTTGRKSLYESALQVLSAHPPLRKASRARLEDALGQITRHLQAAPLTINFDAHSWFLQPNLYSGYTQMYERATKGGVMRLDDSDPLNPANVRAAADDIATLPSAWADMDFNTMKRTWNRFAVKPPAGAPPARGLAPRARGLHDVAKKMVLGPLQPTTDAAGTTQFLATNMQFDPRTKQIFSALNYGRRPHGSCTDYGVSFLVLDNRFKWDALYYAGDTFGALTSRKVKADDQVTYDLLGTAIAKASPTLLADLLRSCLGNATLPDEHRPEYLFEAHLFEELKFTGNITQICVSGRKKVKGSQPQPPTGAEYTAIQTNARAFARTHGARICFID